MKRSPQIKKNRQNVGSWRFFLIVVSVLLITSGASYLYFKPKFSFESPFIANMNSKESGISEETGEGDPSDLYKDSSPVIYEEEFRQDTVLVIAEDVITKVIKPYKIRLHDLYMDRTGVIYIDLSDGLSKDFRGDVLEELNIVAGLYSRIKTSVPGFTALKILIQGKEVESFGGHIDISRPIGEGIAVRTR
jgi:hypothetical protein